MSKIPIALQLFTVRDDCAADFKSTVEQVARIGYKGVELAGNTGGMNAKELKAFLDGLGLTVAGSHVSIDAIVNGLDSAIEFAVEVGNKWIVCPYLGDEWRADAAGWVKTAKTLEAAGAKCREAGIQMCYHNHSFEFVKYDGQYALDLFYASADPTLLQVELDCYWVKHGGEEPVDYIRKYKGRLPLLHLKDMAPGEDRVFAEVGEGILDFPAILAAAQESGVEWCVVEQDICQRPPLESARISFDNLKKMGAV